MELKEVNWGRNYPRMIIGIKGGLTLKRKNWGFRLIYDVYLEKEDGTDELLGTCYVMERPCLCEHKCEICTCGPKFVVKELTSKSPKLVARLNYIQFLIDKCL